MKWVLLFAVPYLIASSWIEDTNSYGDALLKELEPGNKVISPLSTRIALLMAYIGASGETEKVMRQTLRISDDVLPPHFDIPALEISCSAWLDTRYSIMATFEEAVRGGFDGDVFKAAFCQPEIAAGSMNKWIDEKTHGKIPELIDSGSISPLACLFLLNTVYYKEKWQSPFDPKRTILLPFYSKRGMTSVPTMCKSGTYLYHDDGTQQVIALPFAGGGSMALIIVLPRNNNAPLPVNFAALTPTHVRLELPKFSLRKRVDLSSTLAKMGMEDAFSNAANFSGIAEDNSIKIGKVLTETVLEINESGASCAAATAVEMDCKSFVSPGITFSANHPFSVMLIDLNTKLQIAKGEICIL